MPTRVTKSRSYSYKLFGVRHTTRYTTSNRSSGSNVQIHLTGRDILELQRQHAETVAALTQEATERHQEAMRNLSPAAVWLHTPLGAGIGLAVTAITTLIAFAFSGSAPLYYIPAIAFAVIDWHNFSTWHGRVNWRLFHYEKGSALYWTCVIGLGLFAFVPAAIYGIQSLQLAGQVKEIQRTKVQEHIAQLEAELGKNTPPPQLPPSGI